MPVFEEGFATALTARTGVHSRPEAGRREQKARGQRASPHFCAMPRSHVRAETSSPDARPLNAPVAAYA
jgi:hypothetical protein